MPASPRRLTVPAASCMHPDQDQLALQLVDSILQFEFPPLQALYPHIVVMTTGHQMIDRNIQISMLRPQCFKPTQLLLLIVFKVQNDSSASPF